VVIITSNNFDYSFIFMGGGDVENEERGMKGEHFFVS
jgi:hypothetical protein